MYFVVIFDILMGFFCVFAGIHQQRFFLEQLKLLHLNSCKVKNAKDCFVKVKRLIIDNFTLNELKIGDNINIQEVIETEDQSGNDKSSELDKETECIKVNPSKIKDCFVFIFFQFNIISFIH